jgi:two-component sensor histidine kinase
MSDNAQKVRKLLRQQAAIAEFGSFVLRHNDLPKILTEAARACAAGIGAPYAKVCKYREVENDLLIEAGYGWKAGVVGTLESTDLTSPQGRAFVTGKPSIFNDLRQGHGFELPHFYAAHGIVSIVDVVIHVKDEDRPYGVLEIDNDKQHDYDEDDVIFLTGFANVLAEAVATSVRMAFLQTTIEKMKDLTETQERLLGQKTVLTEELHHRVRNNLQLVHGMLSRQLGDTTDEAGRRGLKAIVRRVSTMAQVYNHLTGTEMTRTTDFGSYVKSLCADLSEIHAASAGGVTLTCESDPLVLDLDVVTALGIVVAELVSNSFEHAFPDGKGTANVSVRGGGENDGRATLIVRDDGTGFTAEKESKRQGLGLVKRLIEQIRGTVVVDSERGTIWTIKFPLNYAASPG